MQALSSIESIMLISRNLDKSSKILNNTTPSIEEKKVNCYLAYLNQPMVTKSIIKLFLGPGRHNDSN